MHQLLPPSPLPSNEQDLEDALTLLTTNSCPVGQEISPQSQHNRNVAAWNIREYAKVRQWNRYLPLTRHPSNGDEERYQNGAPFANRYIASFTKGLPLSPDPAKAALGEVDPQAYCQLLKSLQSGSFDEFNQIPLGSIDPLTNQPSCPGPNLPRNLENPQASLGFELQGADSHNLYVPQTNNTLRIGFPPAPSFESPEQISEIAENYWMALLRDVSFKNYTTSNPLVTAAIADLNGYSEFKGPKVGGNVTPQTLFRGTLPGDEIGFFVSQYFLHNIPYGAQSLDGRILPLPPNKDYMTLESDWLAIQRGCDFNQECLPATTRVFMRNGRDLAQFVHVDNVYYGPFNACLLLISGADPLRRCEASAGFGAPFADGIPYVNPFSNTQLFPPSGFQSKNQIGITTFGPNHLKSLVLEVMNRALRAVWYQKWAVHRRLRPEAFAGRIHFHLTQPANPLVAYPFDMPELTKLGSTSQAGSLLDRIFAHNTAQNNASGTGTNPGTYLLPIAYAEGSPLHPSYGQGHATAAGAAVTILKAFFKDVSFADLNQRVLEVKANGMTGNFQGSGSSTIDQITTVHGELNKLASNIGIARNIAGVHYRSDYINSVLLGEQVAINLLDDLYSTFNEKFTFRFRLFNGSEYVLNKSESGPDLNRN